MLSQNPILAATVRSSSDRLRLDDVEEISFSKDFSNGDIGIINFEKPFLIFIVDTMNLFPNIMLD